MKKIRLLRDWTKRDRKNRGMIVIAHAGEVLDVKDGGDIDREDAEALVEAEGAEEVVVEKAPKTKPTPAPTPTPTPTPTPSPTPTPTPAQS